MQRETIAVDFGNYELKVCDGGGDVTAIRSIQYKLPGKANGIKAHTNSPLVEFENGDRIHFGYQATKYNGSLATVTQDKINIAGQHLLACVGRKNADIDIIASHHSPDDVSDRMIDALGGVHIYKRNGQQCRICVRTVTVVPEGMGAYWSAQELGLIPESGYTVVIDMGGGSWLYRLIDEDGDEIHQTVEDKLGTYTLAMRVANDSRLKESLKPHRVTAVKPSLVLDGFANGHRYGDTGVTWKEWLGEYSVPWFQGIMGTVSTDLTEHMPRIKRFLFTGGGAHLVAPVVKGLGNAQSNPFVVMPDPNFANVIGMQHKYSAGNPFPALAVVA